MKYFIFAIVALACVCTIHAGDFIRVFDNGTDGGQQMARIQRVSSFNTAAPMATNELGRLRVSVVLPSIAAKYFAWNGSAVVEPAQAVKDAVDARLATENDTDNDAEAARLLALPQIQALIRLGNSKWAVGQTVTTNDTLTAIKAEL